MQFTDDSLDSLAERLSDLLLKGDEKQSLQVINQLFQDFAGQVPLNAPVIRICESFLEDPVFASQPRLVGMLTDPLILVFPQEEDPAVLREMATLLSRTAANLIQFGDYQLASRILTRLRKHQRQLQASTDEQAHSSEIVFLSRT